MSLCRLTDNEKTSLIVSLAVIACVATFVWTFDRLMLQLYSLADDIGRVFAAFSR